MKTEFKNIVWREGKYYVAQCLNVELSSFGNTKEEALKNLEEAIELYLEDAPADNLNTIEDPEIVYSQIEHA
ncbi:MAG: type II toxin-antitoxin system HicB family antitoxin [Ginsengibacter sp.]